VTERSRPPLNPIPSLTAGEMREVDRIMEEELGISLIQMMENAGRNLARLAVVRLLDGSAEGKKVTVLAGKGGNGGGVMVAARRLAGWGCRVKLILSTEAHTLPPVPRAQLEILRKMGVPVQEGGISDDEARGSEGEGPGGDLILDGLFGYSLSGSPKGPGAEIILWANRQEAPVLSLDLPSGLDPTSGVAHPPTIRATATLTLALPKLGLMSDGATQWVGGLYLADIGVPPQVYEKLAIEVGPLFTDGEILSLPSGDPI